MTVVAIAGIFYCVNAPAVNPALITWFFGIGKYGVGASWVYVSINVYGGATPILAGFLVLLFVLFVSALFCWPIGWLYDKAKDQSGKAKGQSGKAKGQSPVANLVLFTACWALFDWAQTWLLTGFPWLYGANALISTQFAGWLPVFGVLGASALLVLSSSALVVAITHKSLRVLATGVAVLPWLVGALFLQVDWVDTKARHSVALVQANIDQSIKWRPESALPNYQAHVDLTAAHWQSDVVIWPEAAITEYPQRAQLWLEELTERALKNDTSLIVGIPGVEVLDDGYRFYNMALGLGAANGRFSKHHLVPFGEYVPLESLLRGLIQFFDLPMSTTSPGASDQPNITTGIGEIAMAICYEVAYPESMRRAANSAAVLATISNDTWFGASFGPPQHLQIAQARAFENGRWMLRATNNGLTAVIDHRGHIVKQLPQFTAGTLTAEFDVMEGTTPFNFWGHWPLLIFLFGMTVVVWRQVSVEKRTM